MSSSSSAIAGNRHTIYGVPTWCWYGRNLKTFASSTKDNPCRRFYRCVISQLRETEDHLFKWEDEALLDEIRMVDAKRQDLLRDVQRLSNTLAEQFAAQEACLRNMKQKIAQRFGSVSEGADAHRGETNLPTTTAVRTHRTTSPGVADASAPLHTSTLRNIAVAFAVLGTAAWFCSKLT